MGYPPWLTVIGLYNYDNTIFNGIQLPTSVALDWGVFITELLRKAGELPLVYHDPDMLKIILPSWSRSKSYKWDTLAKTIALTYDPIANYDRTEKWVETGGTTDTETNSGSDSGITSATGTDNVAAFNSADLQPQTSSATQGNTTTNYGRTTTNQRIYNDYTRTGQAKGNIGVTTTQEMIKQERDVANFSIYSAIIADFMDDFCIQVW